jgi:transketolase
MINDLTERSNWVWRETLKINLENKETRIASSLSPIDIFVSMFYGKILNFFPLDPFNDKRDRLIVSKGHGSICLYPILADLGYFDKVELDNIGKKGSFLGGIPDPVIPGYETVNGSLGHGLGVSCGIATALKNSKKNQSVFVVVGDGELQEGACWEAIMFAAHHKLDNLNIIIDNNKISMLDFTENIISHKDLNQKFVSFGLDVFECDGHDVNQVYSALFKIKELKNNKPKVLIANTIKGHKVPSIENKALSHILTPSSDELKSLIGGKID